MVIVSTLNPIANRSYYESRLKLHTWDSGDVLGDLQAVEDGGLAGAIQPDDDDPVLPLAPEPTEYGRKEGSYMRSVFMV
jgi:hypothetical protein